jgi:hypothetical protein
VINEGRIFTAGGDGFLAAKMHKRRKTFSADYVRTEGNSQRLRKAEIFLPQMTQFFADGTDMEGRGRGDFGTKYGRGGRDPESAVIRGFQVGVGRDLSWLVR